MDAASVNREVLNGVKAWVPEKKYRTERKFQSDLKGYLEKYLNQKGGFFGFGGSAEEYIISTERGKSRADIAVNDAVGIELKRNFTQAQGDRLRGQIQRYQKEYSYVIVCACGIRDVDVWRRIAKDYGSSGFLGLGSTNITFVHKKADRFGGKSRGRSSTGFFGSGGSIDPVIDEPTDLDVGDVDVDIDDPFS